MHGGKIVDAVIKSIHDEYADGPRYQVDFGNSQTALIRVADCEGLAMPNGRDNPTELWYRASAKNMVFFVLIWLGAASPVFMFIKMIHGSVALYLFLVPWALLGLTMLVRPNWLLRITRAWQKESERMGGQLEKRPPTGLP
jgi:hypothetical protein